MDFTRFKSLLPHVIAVVTFIVVTAVYFFPQLQGLDLKQGDTEQSIGMSKEISDFHAKFHQEPLWTNGAFSGMPTYQISTYHSNYVTPIEQFLIFRPFFRPIGYIVLAMICFYILLFSFDVSTVLSIIGSIAFGLCSIFILYLEAGHNSKVHAIALLPGVIGGLLLAYRKNFWIGSILFCFFLCLEIAANHIQMTYYSLFLIAAILIVEFIRYIRENQFLKFFKISGIVLVAVILAVLPSFSNLYSTYEYGKFSTRGKSDLTIAPTSPYSQTSFSKNALNPDYITQYSKSYGESWDAIIPDAKGGKETYLGDKKDIMENVDPQYQQYVAQRPSYWGEQEFSGGAFYFGASIFVLFVLGMIFIKDTIKWAFFAVSVLAIMLSWKFGGLTQFFIAHFPLFNKFRDTKMILILVQIAFPFIGLLFVKELFERTLPKKKLIYSLLIINGIVFLLYLFPTLFFDFQSTQESLNFNKQLTAAASNPEYQNQFNAFLSNLQNARVAIFKLDTIKSLGFMVCVSLLVYFFAIGKLKKQYFIAALMVFVVWDLWRVDKRYLDNEESGSSYKMWVRSQQHEFPYQASAADMFILNNELSQNPGLQSKIENVIQHEQSSGTGSQSDNVKESLTFRELNFNTDYRVLNLQSPFSDGSTSYFHKSIGGYNGAKLKKYQDVVDFYLTDEYLGIIQAIKDSTVTMEKINQILKNHIPILNLLNTKYIIYNPGTAPFVNTNANGNCWLVKDIAFASNSDQEIQALGQKDLKSTAIIPQKYQSKISSFRYDSTASIRLESCISNKLTYKSKATTAQFAVFSEIYYPYGWNVYIDGKKSEIISADYILRSMNIPAGEHEITFRFEPKSYAIGEKISQASSVLVLLLLAGSLVGGIILWFKKG